MIFLDNNFDDNKISINKYSDVLYNTKYSEKGFLIKPNIAFSNSSYFFKNMYKIRININILDKEHKCFKEFIDKIYDSISLFIEGDDEISVDTIIRPTIKSNMLPNTEILHLIINRNTELLEYFTNKIIDKQSLINKRFTIYPIINSPNINNSNDKMYLNFSLKKAFIRLDESLENNNSYINKKELDEAFNKTKLMK